MTLEMAGHKKRLDFSGPTFLALEMVGPKKDLIFQDPPFLPSKWQGPKKLDFQGPTLPIALEMAGPKKVSICQQPNHYVVAEAYTTQPNSKASSRVLYNIFESTCGG
jgi:hypothetical protein